MLTVRSGARTPLGSWIVAVVVFASALVALGVGDVEVPRPAPDRAVASRGVGPSVSAPPPGAVQDVSSGEAASSGLAAPGDPPGGDQRAGDRPRVTVAPPPPTAVTPTTAPVVFAGPITITAGGTYSGAWESTDPATPAVTIATTERVLLERFHTRSVGTHIVSDVPGIDLTVRQGRATGTYPGVEGASAGRFTNLQDARNVRIESTTLVRTAGIYLLGFTGDGSPGQTIKVLRTKVVNIDGRHADGAGGWKQGEDDFDRVQFVQLDKVVGLANVEIAWNEVTNRFGESRVEDVVNLYRSSGTEGSPISVHDNLVDGAYPAGRDHGFSGGGILLADGEGGGWAEAQGNVVVRTVNYGIAIGGGSGSSIRNNHVVGANHLPGRPGEVLAAANVGIYIWDASSDPSWSDNSATGNVVTWDRADGTRNDWWFPDVEEELTEGNVSSPDDPTTRAEDAQVRAWHARVSTAGVEIGAG